MVKEVKKSQSKKLFDDDNDPALELKDVDYKSRTRTSLYEELQKNERAKTEEDFFEFPNPVARAIALVIDIAFLFFGFRLCQIFLPFIKTFYLWCLDRINLQVNLSDHLLSTMLLIVVCSLFYYIVVLIPIAFFNTSMGKKIMDIKIRGDHIYTLSMSDCVLRELIYKPISIGLLIGFLLPFFDKRKKSLHDKFSKTFAIKD